MSNQNFVKIKKNANPFKEDFASTDSRKKKTSARRQNQNNRSVKHGS